MYKVLDSELDKELKFSFSRSGGPGGQSVNKLNTKVELRFNINASDVLDFEQKDILMNSLSNQISNDGFLVITSSATRSQLKNKEDAISKFYALINKSLKPRKKRKVRSIPKSLKEKRLKDKRENSLKKERRKIDE